MKIGKFFYFLFNTNVDRKDIPDYINTFEDRKKLYGRLKNIVILLFLLSYVYFVHEKFYHQCPTISDRYDLKELKERLGTEK